ncbi:sulfhydryl oxidase 1 [Betta splendens]|uniref:Sulfhydryl oxidase n=1 Tax=Betta splendens TaxID=158456 RepID=A0A6P7MAN6_BETSP|nr:sulfhydryl oxidase 1 [Betta splendens]
MAQRCGRATSRFAAQTRSRLRRSAASALCLCFYLLLPSAAEAGLYTASDQIQPLTPENAGALLVNSTAAIVVEFYASWCGHCVAFAPVYKELARDIKEWKPALDLAAIDCAAKDNRRFCSSYGITGYPSLKFFHAFSQASSTGRFIRGFHHDFSAIRQKLIDKLETHKDLWPPACPPLEPTSQAEVDRLFETNSVQHLALIFEKNTSYIGREVTLDLLQFENIAVRRVLSTEKDLVTLLGVTDFPSCYLYYPGGTFTRLQVNLEARTFYSSALQRLPGVVRSGKPPPVSLDVLANNTKEPWRPFNSSRVYMADLESALHYSLRVEVAAHPVIRKDALTSLKKYVAVLAKYFPGRPVVMNLLRSVDRWLQSQPGDEIQYEALEGILDNSAQTPNTALPEGETWVGCQGSQPHLRRYPCGVWTLFHVLTVVQSSSGGSTDPREVLGAMRGYVRSFFGCRHCAEHFENMARESMVGVRTAPAAAAWLWSRHNVVNNRLAGALSEDPNFPKIQWPSPEMCPSCHTVDANGDHKWNDKEVLRFLPSYFSASGILTDYLEDESKVLEKQRLKHAARKARDAPDPVAPTPSSVQGEEEDEEEELQDEEEEAGEGGADAGEMGAEPSEPTPWDQPAMDLDPGPGRGRGRGLRRPSIVGMRLRGVQEDIVDLDSFVNQLYNAKALRLAASSRVKQRSLQRKEEREPGPRLRLGMELDAGLGMVGLQPMEADYEPDAQKREAFAEELDPRGRWMSVLSIGFSRVDISLCVILYALSSMCLLAMYLFFKNRFRLRRKAVLP